VQHSTTWRMEMGATVTPAGVRFRVWAPRASHVEVVVEAPQEHTVAMQRRADGIWEALLPGCGAGTRYLYRVRRGAFPDPYSRFQPQGVHGPSEVVDAFTYAWSDQGWSGIDLRGLVIYECHVGTTTSAGTCDALIGQLPRLKALGISALELMPMVECPGRRNWGYDGVYPFAVSANYGGPEALKRLVDAAHQCGLGMILDVVYNHLGPEGNYFRQFSPYYFSTRYRTPWGEALNYDGPSSYWVRRLVLDNACYWFHEYHVDGLRLDATGQIFDSSQPHILQEVTQTVRASLSSTRRIVLIAETSDNDVRYLLPCDAGGYGFDVLWVDDFYWSLRRYLTGDHEGRYQDYAGTLEETARTINQGFLYEGEFSAYKRAPRGTPARQQPAWQFQYCLQHHDHVGNRGLGDRLHHHVDLGRYRVASALVLLLPYTPLIFMGQEFVASSAFQFFSDHSADLGRQVTAGRRRELSIYEAFATPEAAARIPDPQAEATFLRSRLPLDELTRSPGKEMQRLYKELLHLRRTDAVLRRQDRHTMQARALASDLLAVIWQGAPAPRLLLANFAGPVVVDIAGLLSVQKQAGWHMLLDTGAPQFGGSGATDAVHRGVLCLPARTAVFLARSHRRAESRLSRGQCSGLVAEATGAG
jgi:maltooligosyltrehalose trehalohydrolase